MHRDESKVADPPAQPVVSVGRGAALVTAGILLSRLVGIVRQRVLAHYLGAGPFADVITAGFRLGNITQNLLGEGTLSASFIPEYVKLERGGRQGDARHFARSALGLLLALLAVLSALGVAAAPWLTWLVAAGFPEDKLEATVRVVRITFPMTALLVLCAWALGVLNAHRRFFLPYAAPVVGSAVQIAALLALGPARAGDGDALASIVALSALAGAGLQLAVLLPATRRLLGSIAPRFDPGAPGLREAASRLPAALVGRGVLQLSGLVDMALASFLGSGSQAVMTYAQTLYFLPMAVLGTGEAAASLPEMARDAADADLSRRHAAIRERLGASLSRVTVLTIPATALFLVFGRELVALLLQGGSFDVAATDRVVPVLGVYGVALLANAGGRVLATTCFALGDTRTPARTAVLRVVVSTAASLVLMRPFGVEGLVGGAVVAGWVEALALAMRVREGVGGLGLQRVPFAKVLALGAACVAAGLGIRASLPAPLAGTRLGAAATLAAYGGAFAALAPALGLFRLGSLLRRR